jgi:hypothetical protein
MLTATDFYITIAIIVALGLAQSVRKFLALRGPMEFTQAYFEAFQRFCGNASQGYI